MADLDAEDLADPERHQQAGDYRDEGEQVVLAACRAGHTFEELLPVEDADSVQEHDQADQADRPGDLRLRRNSADREADEQHGADAERKAEDVDLAHQIAEADGEKDRENRLGSEDALDEFPHGSSSRSARIAARGAKLIEHAL